MVDRITPVTTPDVIDVAGNGIRRRGPMAGRRRAVHLLGARGRLLRRPAGVRGRRRAARRRRHALRADEAAAAQRQPPEPVLLRLPGRLPAGARRRGRPAVRRVPAASTWIRRRRRRCCPCPGIDLPRLQADGDRALRQPRRARHHRPAVLRVVGPHPEVAAARHPGEPRVRRARSGCPRPPSPAGPATPRASTSRASRSTSRISSRNPWCRSPSRNSRHPTAFIENTAVFGDLADQPRFVEAYLWALDSLHRHGARATLEALCGGTSRVSAARAGHRRGADRHRRTRRAGDRRRTRRRQPTQRRGRAWAGSVATSTS